jgi:Tfp pilus assembly protein FimT
MLKTASTERGFSLSELLVVVGLIMVLSVVAVPSVLTYWRTSSLTAGAEQLAGVMNRARQLAISTNNSVCVQVTGSNVRLRTVSCAGTIWTGIGTDSTGVIQIANSLQVSGGTSAIFTNIGGASTTATYTLTDPKTGRTRSVVVAATGRVTIQ